VRELAPVIGLLQRRPPRIVVEIGTARGGTFFVWCRVARSDAVIVSIDLPGGRFGGGYASGDISVFQQYGRPEQQRHFIRADSHAADTRARLEEILRGEEIDFLMIDGDHTYDGVKQDFEMYAPLVADGKVIAFHDILPHPHEASCEVDRFWREIRSRYRHLEFLDQYRDRLGHQYGGIGILYWEKRSGSDTVEAT
jgi:predicted O-methyltransferase YrrM